MSAVKISPAKPFSLQHRQPASDVLTASRFPFSSPHKPLIHRRGSRARQPWLSGCRWVESLTSREASPVSLIPVAQGGRHQGRRSRASQPCQISDQKCKWGGPGLTKVRTRARKASSHSSGLLL